MPDDVFKRIVCCYCFAAKLQVGSAQVTNINAETQPSHHGYIGAEFQRLFTQAVT